jgi:hypothetical protein
VELNGEEPLAEPSAQREHVDRPRSAERRRTKRRTRLESRTRARIRLHVWIACTGALLIMAVMLYLTLGHDAASGQGVAPAYRPGGTRGRPLSVLALRGPCGRSSG